MTGVWTTVAMLGPEDVSDGDTGRAGGDSMIVETLDTFVSCDFSRNIWIGVIGRAVIDRSLVAARLARLLRLLSKLGGLSSKSSGKNALGALWKSTRVLVFR